MGHSEEIVNADHDVLDVDDFEDIVDIRDGCAPGVSSGEEDGDQDFTIEEQGSSADNIFDAKVGGLEEIVMDNKFQEMLKEFSLKHCDVFEDTEENKFEYTSIFKSYSETIEKYLEVSMVEKFPGFSMEQFIEELASREDEVDGEVFEMLVSLADFETFKQQMLAYKNQNKVDLVLQGSSVPIHEDEQEDGEVRPDLEDLMKITPASPAGSKKRIKVSTQPRVRSC